MSITYATTSSSNASQIGRSALVGPVSPCIKIYGDDPPASAGDSPSEDRRPALLRRSDSDSCSSSSIGRNSDSSADQQISDADDSAEVQSSFKGPLDTMDSLEASLPIRRGISRFYCGKSKSFTNIGDAYSSSVKDLGKPDNPYCRKRKNLFAYSNLFDKNRSLRNNGRGGIAKKPANLSRSTLALAVAMNSSDSSSGENHVSDLPPLHPQQGKFSINGPPLQRSLPSRSVSLMDLHHHS